MSDKKIITKQLAMEQGLKHYFTGEPCKYGHIENRLVSNRGCVTCLSDRTSDWKQLNKEQISKYRKDFHLANLENQREKGRIRANKYYYENYEVVLEKQRIFGRRYSKENPHIYQIACAKRRAAKLNRTPIWLTEADHAEIKHIYEVAAKRTKKTGIVWHVDHIIPLRGKTVSGLHVPRNLKVIPASQNYRKGNKWDESASHQIKNQGA
jgi:hypothetical protein